MKIVIIKLLKTIGILFIISGVIFLLVHSFIVTGSRNEPFARDLFGFPIPHPPLWTSYIPYLGGFLGFIFEFFSIHGLVGLVISGTLFMVGGFLVGISDKKLDPKYFPVLYKWVKENPETLESQLKSIADKWHEGNILSAMQALESDLEHG